MKKREYKYLKAKKRFNKKLTEILRDVFTPVRRIPQPTPHYPPCIGTKDHAADAFEYMIASMYGGDQDAVMRRLQQEAFAHHGEHNFKKHVVDEISRRQLEFLKSFPVKMQYLSELDIAKAAAGGVMFPESQFVQPKSILHDALPYLNGEWSLTPKSVDLYYKPGEKIDELDEVGCFAGDLCNRNGCTGIIEERKNRDGGCSCHINPPCNYCVTDPHYCPVCGWHGEDEQKARK